MIFDVTINAHGKVDICGYSNDRTVRGLLFYNAGVAQVLIKDRWPVEQLANVNVVRINGGEIELTGMNWKGEAETWTAKAVLPECGVKDGSTL